MVLELMLLLVTAAFHHISFHRTNQPAFLYVLNLCCLIQMRKAKTIFALTAVHQYQTANPATIKEIPLCALNAYPH